MLHDVEEVHDVFTKEQLLYSVFELSNFVDKSSPTELATLVFFTKNSVIVGDDTFLTYRPFTTVGPYQFPPKSIQFLKRMLATGQEPTYEFTYHNQYITHVRNGTRTFTFVCNDVMEPDQSPLQEFTADTVFTLAVSPLRNVLPLLLTNCVDSYITFHLKTTGELTVFTTNGVDKAIYTFDYSDVTPIKLSTDIYFGFYPEEFAKHIKLLKEETLTFEIDTEFEMVKLTNDARDKTSLLTIILETDLQDILSTLKDI